MDNNNDLSNILKTSKKLFLFLFKNKYKIIFLSILFSVIFYFLSYTQPDKYYSEALITSQNQSKTASGVGSSIGSLSSVIGIGIGQNDTSASDFQIALELFKSRKFILAFVDKYNLEPGLIAGIGYDKKSNKIIYDKDIYSEDLNKMLVNALDANIYLKFTSSIIISKNKSFYRIGFSSLSPEFSEFVVSNAINEINEYMRVINNEASLKTYEYLLLKSKEVTDINTKSILNSLLENQLKDMALIFSSPEYVLRVIDPPYYPEFRSSPNRFYFIIFGFIFGFLSACLMAFILDQRNGKY